MNIGLLTPYFPDSNTIDSGIANHVLLLAKSLAQLNNNVVVIHVRGAYKEDIDSEDCYLINDNISVITIKITLPNLLKRALKNNWALNDFGIKMMCMIHTKKKLNEIILKNKLDVIETSSYFSLGYFSLKSIGKTPMIVRVSTTFSQIMENHYLFKSRMLKLIGTLEIRFIKKSKYLITHAKSHANELSSLYRISNDRFSIISHGITLPALWAKPESQNSPLKILFVGRLEFRKGIDVLLKAIPMIVEIYPNVIFEIIGYDTNNEYQKSFKATNSGKAIVNTIFKGKIEKPLLETAYRECDIFVAPSRYESFGIIYIEAMSFGKPVIGCDVGGVSTIIEPGINGYFSIPGDALSLVQQIERLLNDPEKRQIIGANARKTVEEKFTGKQLAERSLAYYSKLIENRR